MRWIEFRTMRAGAVGEGAGRSVFINADLVVAVEDAAFPAPASRIVTAGGGNGYYVPGSPSQVLAALGGEVLALPREKPR